MNQNQRKDEWNQFWNHLSQDREKRRIEKIAEKENRQKQIKQEQWEMHKDRMQQYLIKIFAKIVERKQP